MINTDSIQISDTPTFCDELSGDVWGFPNSAMPAMPGNVFCLHSKYHDELFGDLQILHALLQGFSCVELGKEMTGKRWWKCQCCLFFCQKKRKGEYFLDFISVCQRVKKNA